MKVGNEMDKKIIASKWRLFKKSAVMTMGLQKSTSIEKESTIEEINGSVFLEFAISKAGTKEYDWAEKRLFKLDHTDLAKIVTEQEFHLVHNPLLNKPEDDGSKVQHLSFSLLKESKDPNSQTFGFLTLVHNKGKIAIAMSRAEYFIFIKLCESAIPIILGFK